MLTAAKKTEVDLTANISCLRLELADLQQKYDSDLALKESKVRTLRYLYISLAIADSDET